MRQKCEEFLEKIRDKISDRVQIDIDAAQQAKAYINDKQKKVVGPEAQELLVDLSRIFCINLEFNTSATLSQTLGNSIYQFIQSRCALGACNSIAKKELFQQYKNF
ncbi:MAG: hypothetical protein P1P84_19365 [Deferrisomatales bacterium]|nr:hypothetical protein [Deferrisomatales bacterium]